MHETEMSDLSDDADYAASQEQEKKTNSVDDNSRRGGHEEPVGSEVVYSKDNVAIHPTQYASERISGRLRLIKQGSSLVMTWIPYKTKPSGHESIAVGQSSQSRIPERDRSLYSIKAVPLTDVRSIRRHTPTLGWQYVIVVLSSGLAFPPLYFYNGGVREFLATIKQHVLLVRSADDSNVFLVNYLQDPLQRSLSSLQLPRAVSISNGTPSQFFSTPFLPDDVHESVNENVIDGNSSISEYSERTRHKAHDPARDLSIQVLEKFSLVTKFARDTTSHLFGEIYNDGLSEYDRKTKTPSTSVDTQIKRSDSSQKNLDAVPVASDPLGADKISLVWGKPRQRPLGLNEWASFLDSEGRITDSDSLRKRVFYGGVEHGLRKEVWKFLLGFHPWDSTYAEREYFSACKKSEYEIIKHQWKSISMEQAKRFTKYRERKGLIEKDVVRTDRSVSFYDGDNNPNVRTLHDILLTYSFYNFDLGYCQGMSDLLAPILFVMGDESESFWCFVSLMERLGPNFNRDQSGMHAQLFALSKLVEILDGPLHNYFKQADCLNYFFCFRWILIQFKREFTYDMIMRMWEVLWTHYLSEHFHLYVCVAILKRYRKKIIGEQMDFDTLLKFINELSGSIDLDTTLRDAEALCFCAGENGAACIPPGTPPSLPIETGVVYSNQEDEVL